MSTEDIATIVDFFNKYGKSNTAGERHEARQEALRQARVALENITREIEQEKASFDIRWNADMRAIKMWQKAHPGNDLVWPDHAALCVWLLEQLDAERQCPQCRDPGIVCSIHGGSGG